MERKKSGRPMIYPHLILVLDDEKVYSPALIVDHAQAKGLLDGKLCSDQSELRVRIRHTLTRLAANRGFPKHGDGLVVRRGQAVTVGWFGNRWKETLTPNNKARAKQILSNQTAD